MRIGIDQRSHSSVKVYYFYYVIFIWDLYKILLYYSIIVFHCIRVTGVLLKGCCRNYVEIWNSEAHSIYIFEINTAKRICLI